MEKRLIPEIRFKGFVGDWEEKKFRDCVKLSQGLQIPIAERLVKETPDSLFYITNEFLNPNSKVRYYIKNAKENVKANKDDILMTRTGNTGKVITDVEGVFHNNFFKVAYEKNTTDKYFLYHLLKSPKIQKEILVRAGTSTIPDLNHGDFYGIKHCVPEIAEQEKIGRLFESLDQTIEIQGKVVEENKRLKQALLHKLFPKKGQKLPELRLRGFGGDWEEKKLEDICEINKGTQLNKNEVVENGKYYHLNGGKEPSNYTDKWNVEANTISISEGGNSCGYVNWNKERFFSGGHNYTLKLFSACDLYLYQCLKARESRIMRLRVGSGLPNIQKRALSNFKIPIPSLPEQEAIGKLFKSLDEKIAREEERLEGYKTLKKSLLQKMFV